MIFLCLEIGQFMSKLNLDEVYQYVEENIGIFHCY